MRYLTLAIFCFITFSSTSTKAVKYESEFRKPTQFRASILNAGIGMPPHFIDGRLQLGAEIGVLHPLKKNKYKYWNYTMHLGYFAQQSLQRATYIKPGIGYSLKVKKKIIIRPSLNLSLMGVWQTNDEFKFIGNGQYEKVKRYRMQVMPSLGVEALIPISNMNKVHSGFKLAYSLLLRYEFGVQTPFSNLSSILPINQLHIGVNAQF